MIRKGAYYTSIGRMTDKLRAFALKLPSRSQPYRKVASILEELENPSGIPMKYRTVILKMETGP